MTKTKGNLLNLIAAFTGFIMAIAMKTVAKSCQGMLILETGKQVPMRCHYAATAIFFIGLITVVIGIESFCRKKQSVFTYIMIMVALLLITNNSVGIGVCVSADMACSTTKIVTTVLGVVIGLVGILQFFVKGDKEL